MLISSDSPTPLVLCMGCFQATSHDITKGKKTCGIAKHAFETRLKDIVELILVEIKRVGKDSGSNVPYPKKTTYVHLRGVEIQCDEKCAHMLNRSERPTKSGRIGSDSKANRCEPFFKLTARHAGRNVRFCPAMLTRQEQRDPDCYVHAIDG